MLMKDPNLRMTAQAALHHEWMVARDPRDSGNRPKDLERSTSPQQLKIFVNKAINVNRDDALFALIRSPSESSVLSRRKKPLRIDGIEPSGTAQLASSYDRKIDVNWKTASQM